MSHKYRLKSWNGKVSIFSFNGTPYPFFAYYFYLAAMIDFFTFHILSLVLLQHLTVVASFFMAGVCTYSEMGQAFGGQAGDCPVTEDVSDRLLRLPFYNTRLLCFAISGVNVILLGPHPSSG